MACVRMGSLVEMVDLDGRVWMQEVETIRPGDTLRDPMNGNSVTVITTLMKKTGGLCPLVQYMGLTADLEQYVHIPGDGWVMAGDVGTSSIHFCPQIYAIVVSSGNMARIDGVTCCVHSPMNVSSVDTATLVGPLSS